MGRARASKHDADRFLHRRNELFHYKRRVPKNLIDVDDRSPHVRHSLKTDDLALARAKRDAFELADDELWAAMVAGDDVNVPLKRYEAAVKRAEALGFSYRGIVDMAAHAPVSELVARMDAVMDGKVNKPNVDAALGLVEKPRLTVRQAYALYISEIVPHELASKSKVQREDWKKVKKRAVNNFVKVVADKIISEISRDDALKFYKFWTDRVAPAKGPRTHSASSGNRDIGNMRKLFREYHRHIGDRELQNPFADLAFSERIKNSRPPFPVEWIKSKFLQAGELANLNAEARAIVLVMIEGGERPSEICNLGPENIFLDGPTPYLDITPRTDPEDPREIKTTSSVRQVPLVGVALAAMEAHPNGFPRYRNNERTLSNTLNKYFKAHGLLPTEKHSVYSLRHSFEDRMKVAGLDDELRRMLMGHAIARPKYGAGGSPEWRRDELMKIVLPFDSAIV